MNPDYISNSVVDNTLNKFAFRPYAVNVEPYEKLKSLNYHKKWDNICKPNPTKDIKQFIIGLYLLIMVCIMKDSHI